MSDRFGRFVVGRHAEPSATCALCVVANYKLQRPHVTVYFPHAVYERLDAGLPSLLRDYRGNWMVGSTVTTVRNIKHWLERYDAWDTVRDAETVLFGDTWKSTDDWRYYLARAS